MLGFDCTIMWTAGNNYLFNVITATIWEWWWGSGANGQERILQTSLVQKGDFIFLSYKLNFF